MKLSYPEWNKALDFNEDTIWVVNIENPVFFSKVVDEINKQQMTGIGRFVLSEGENILPLDKSTELIISPLLLDFENKKLQNALIKHFVKVANEEEYLESKRIATDISKYLYNLSDYIEVNVEIPEEIDTAQLIKAAGIKIAHDDDTVVNRFVDYLILQRDLLNASLIICVNIKKYFSVEELKKIYSTMALKKIPLLLFESGSQGVKIVGENCLTIDEDLCEI